MRKVVLTHNDFEMFDTDISSVEFEFFHKHKEAFKRMWIEQGRKFWIQFVMSFRQFAVDYGAIKEFPAKNDQFEDFVDQAFIIIHENFVEGKYSTARSFVMDIVMMAQNRHTVQYLESKSYAKDPFYNKETRDVFRRLFGPPTEKSSYVKVYVLLPIYMKYGGAVCICLRRWLDAEEIPSAEDIDSVDDKLNSSLNDKTETNSSSSGLSRNNSPDCIISNECPKPVREASDLHAKEITKEKEVEKVVEKDGDDSEKSTAANKNTESAYNSENSDVKPKSSMKSLRMEHRRPEIEEEEERLVRSGDYFELYIREVKDGIDSGPMFVSGWPIGKDPRFFDPDNPLFNPDNEKPTWKDGLRLPDFARFVIYVRARYRNGKKQYFDESDEEEEQHGKSSSPTKSMRKKMAKIEADGDLIKDEEDKRLKAMEDKKRQRKVRKKIKKGLPVTKEELGMQATAEFNQMVRECEQRAAVDPVYAAKREEKRKEMEQLAQQSRNNEVEPNSVKLTKKVDEKKGTVSLTIEKRDSSGRLTTETTIKPISEDGNIWEEAMQKISPLAGGGPSMGTSTKSSPPVLNDKAQMALATKLSQGNFGKEDQGKHKSGGVNDSSNWVGNKGNLSDEDSRQFREMYREIASAIGDVSRQNQAEEDKKCTHFMCNHDTRHEKARNRLRRKLGEKKQDRKNPDLPGLVRLGGTIEYPATEQEAMMITIAEMTKMNTREKELFQERLGRTKYFRDQEDPRDVADWMGAFLFPGIKETMKDKKAQKKKARIREKEKQMDAEKKKKIKKEKPQLEPLALGKTPELEITEATESDLLSNDDTSPFEDKSRKDKSSNDEEEITIDDLRTVVGYKNDVKRMKDELHYNTIRLNRMMEKQKKDKKKYVKTGREFEDQVRQASEDLRVLEEKIAHLDKECAGINNPDFNKSVMKAAEELKAVKKKVEKWETDAEILNEKLDRYEKDGDLDILLDGDPMTRKEVKADKPIAKEKEDPSIYDTHPPGSEGVSDEILRLAMNRNIDQEQAYKDFKEILERRGYQDDESCSPDEKELIAKMRKVKELNQIKDEMMSSDRNFAQREKLRAKFEARKKALAKMETKVETDNKKTKGNNGEILLEINERIKEDKNCKIPNCSACKCFEVAAHGNMTDDEKKMHGDGSTGCNDATQQFIDDLDSGAIPPPPPGVSITVLQRVTEPAGLTPDCSIKMGDPDPMATEFKSYWKAAKSFGPTSTETMLNEPKKLSIVHSGMSDDQLKEALLQSDAVKVQLPKPKTSKIQVKIAREPKEKKTVTKSVADSSSTVKAVPEPKSDKSEPQKVSKDAKSKGKELRKCSGCDNTETTPKQYKKCQKCKQCGTKNARYYCSRDCQVSDWTKKHKNEHKDNKLE